MITLKIYSCRIPARINAVGTTVADILLKFRDIYGDIGESAGFEFKVILNELILNAVKHGCHFDCNKFVKISIGLAAGHYAVVQIEDEGTGFDYGHTASDISVPMGDCFQMKETGRGIIIASSLSNRIRFNRQGNRVLVLKDLC